MDFKDSMHNGDVPALHLEHDDVAHADRLLAVVGEEQQVAAVERRLHAAAGIITFIESGRGMNFLKTYFWTFAQGSSEWYSNPDWRGGMHVSCN